MNKRFLYSIVLYSTLIVLFSCSNGEQNQITSASKLKNKTHKYPGQKAYFHSMDGTPTTLDPVRAATNYSNFLVLNVFDTLYSYKYLGKTLSNETQPGCYYA